MSRIGLLLFCTLLTFIISCNSSRIVKTWKDPDTQVSVEKLNKVLVVAFLRDETSRRTAEDKMASLLNGKAVTSYSYFKDDIKSLKEDDVRNQLKNDGFDGAVTMRLVDVDKDVTYTPGTFSTYPVYYRTFGGYYLRGWSYYSTPERYQTTKTYSVETNVYSLKQDKLVWSGLTESTNPGGVDKLTADISNTVYKRMVKEGFISQ